jgi:hypothetical protein
MKGYTASQLIPLDTVMALAVEQKPFSIVHGRARHRMFIAFPCTFDEDGNPTKESLQCLKDQVRELEYEGEQ